MSRQRPSRLPMPLAHADDAEADAAVQLQRRLVLGEDRRLDRPDPGVLALRDQLVPSARGRRPRPWCVARDVDARLGDAAVRPARRDRRRAPPSRRPRSSSSATTRIGRCAASHASHGGTSVSKVAMPSRSRRGRSPRPPPSHPAGGRGSTQLDAPSASNRSTGRTRRDAGGAARRRPRSRACSRSTCGSAPR